MNIKGKVHKYGDNIDTDVIIPARYLNSSDLQTLAAHCMEDADRDFVNKVKKGDIIVAGKNFGCGSSREHAPMAIKASGISIVIAESFARIFYRNSINIGLPILECEQIGDVADKSAFEIDTDLGVIKDLTSGKIYKAESFPPFIKGIIESGGLLNYIANDNES